MVQFKNDFTFHTLIGRSDWRLLNSIRSYIKQHMICFGCSKKSSQWDGSFEYPQHELLLGKRKHDFSSNTLIWISG